MIMILFYWNYIHVVQKMNYTQKKDITSKIVNVSIRLYHNAVKKEYYIDSDKSDKSDKSNQKIYDSYLNVLNGKVIDNKVYILSIDS